MAISDQKITDKYAVYLGDCMEVIAKMPANSVDFSVYSPPFAGLYNYTSNPRDMSNCDSYEQFMANYEFLIAEKHRVTKPGRMSAVQCVDIPSGNTGRDHLRDFPGDIIRSHEKHGFRYAGRYCVWKAPFDVYLRTLAKSLRHRTFVEDSSRCMVASADYLLVFRKDGENAVPITHPTGVMTYAGSREPPQDTLKYRGWTGKQTENKYSQWVMRQYVSAFWDDVRIDRVLPFIDAKEPDDERHVHPLQLDVIERAITLWSNPGEIVLTPFMGVGSEVYGAVLLGRKGIGMEIKPSYYKQALKNIEYAATNTTFQSEKQAELFAEASLDMGSD
jgi:DNA modification methylase